ncbi:class F sortase [Streptomyces sp. NPDC051207]|uniref:class F sortase n=1 Tax=Streptomyces sp. NPDC051207 TaxID=3154641 RepID=UPI00341322A4
MDESGRFGHGSARRPERRRIALSVGALTLVLVGGLLLAMGMSRQAGAPSVRADIPGSLSTSPPPKSESGERPALRPLPYSAPVQVSISSIGVSSSLEELGRDENKAMETPRDPAKAGWYRPGPAPGTLGPAIIAGHVTFNGTPSVFFKLAQLKTGATIKVKRKDGVTAQFTVNHVAQYPKDRFPTVDVYRNLDHAGLRLITCGGAFSKESRRYADNVVVYASLTGARRS